MDIHKILGKPVVLLIDELMKLGLNAANKIMNQVGTCLNNLGYFDCVVSTLDSSPIFSENRLSGRKLMWVQLPRLTDESSEKIFHAFKLTDEIRLLLKECAGHPRSLQCIYTAMTDLLPKGSHLLTPKLILERAVKDWGARVPSIGVNHLKAALLGGSTKIGDTLFGLDVSKEISNGTFVNSDIHSEYQLLIPKLSPFSLRVYSHTVAAQVHDDIASAIDNMLRDEEGFSWCDYERFHAYWEVLKRLLYQGDIMQLSQFYNLNYSRGPKFVLKQKSVKRLEVDFATFLKQTNPTTEQLQSFVYLPKDGNEGFDIAIFEENDITKEVFAILVECKFSRPTATTSVSGPTVQNKWDGSLKQLLPLKSKIF